MPATKSQLRLEMKSLRSAMPAEEAGGCSDLIRRRVLDLEQLQVADCVFTYVSIQNEPDTYGLIRDLLAAGKRVSVPRIETEGTMQAHIITSLDDLTPGDPDQFGIPVPPPETPIEPHPEIALVPGLAFTEAGQRLGMGGGHYDRYFAKHPDTPGTPGTLTVGLCYGWQVVNELPHELHDQPVHNLVTEDRVISCHG